MAITLQQLAASGETAYIAKHNANYGTIEMTINSLLGSVSSLQSGAASPINAINIGKAAFGPLNVSLVGETSFATSTAGTNLTLQPGFYWNGATAQMLYKSTTTVLSFSGAAAATYYIRIGADGIPYRDTSSAAALYSVVWTGSAFGTITKLAAYAVGYQDLLDLLSSSYSGITYASPDKRIEATEKAFSALLTKAITTADVTLTTAEAMESAVIRLTSAPTAARNLIVPAKAKVYFIDNDTTGAFSVTIKTASGTGVALASGTNGAVFCDGTNVVSISTGAGGGGGATAFTGLTDAPASYSGQANKAVKVKADESGLEFSTDAVPTVFTGLTDVPASYSGQAGKVPVVNPGETGLEFGSPVSTFLALTDSPDSYVGYEYRVVSVNGDGTGLEFTTAAAPSTFLALTDAPDTYTANALKVVRVNAAGTALEFATGTGPQNFLELPDTPSAYTASALKFLRVNAAMTAVEFASLDLTTLLGLTDTPDTYAGAAYRVITVKGDESGVEFSEAAAPTAFIGLTDAPASYSGHGSKTVKVKADATGLEFVTVPATVTAFTGLSDVPADYTGAALKKVRVNAGGTALEFVTDTSGATAFTGLTDVPASFAGQALKGVRVNAAANALEFYDEPVVIGVAWNGVAPANQRLGLYVATFAIDFAAAMAGSSGIALVSATAQTDITVNKIASGSHTVTAVGTVRFAAAGGAPTFIAASAFSLAVGDALEFKAPGTADATLADFSFSVAGVR